MAIFSGTKRRPGQKQLHCERLEDRRLLAGDGVTESLEGDDTLGSPDPLPPLESGSIHGRKWEDFNADGYQDDDEPGLAGVTIYSDRNFDGRIDTVEPHTVTMRDDPETDFDETGLYLLEGLHPGFHMVREIVPEEFRQTFPSLPPGYQPPPWGDASAHVVFVDAGATVEGVDFGNQKIEPASVHGIKWLDKNGNGQRDQHEPGLPGVTIYVDFNRNGMLDDDEPHTRTMEDNPLTDFDETGRYGLNHLPAGEHWVAEVIPDGFVQTFPSHQVIAIFPPPPGGGVHEVKLEPGELVERIDFGNRREQSTGGFVQGIKWLDENGNGQRDRYESGLPGVTIYVDVNLNGMFDSNEPHTVTMEDNPLTDFDESGHYGIKDLSTGVYLVREIVPDGYQQTFPVNEFGPVLPGPGPLEDVFSNLFAEVRPEKIDLALSAGETVQREVAITIFPNLFRAIEIDVVASVSDVQLVNLTGTIVNGGGGDTSVFDVMFTGDGLPRAFDLQFVDAELGGVTGPAIPVRINAPEGGGAHRVVVLPGEAIDGVDFGNQKIEPASVHGIKWLDKNGNGQRDQQEPGLPGVTIYVDFNRNGMLDDDEPHTRTMEDNPLTDFDETGRYGLNHLPAGEHWVAEVIPDGFVQTFPSHQVIAIFPPPPGGGVHEVKLESGELVERIDFGNRREHSAAGSVQGIRFLDENGNHKRDSLDTLVVTFNEDVNVNTVALTLLDETAGGTPVELTGVTFNYNAATLTATWDFTGVSGMDAGFYKVVLDATLITNTFGSQLDGDGNGIRGDDFHHVLLVAKRGDTDVDGDIDLTDYNRLATNFDPAGIRFPHGWCDANFDADFDIDLTDYNNVTDNFAPEGYAGTTPALYVASGCELGGAPSFAEPLTPALLTVTDDLDLDKQTPRALRIDVPTNALLPTSPERVLSKSPGPNGPSDPQSTITATRSARQDAVPAAFAQYEHDRQSFGSAVASRASARSLALSLAEQPGQRESERVRKLFAVQDDQ